MDMASETSWLPVNRKLEVGNMKAVQTSEVGTPLALHSIGNIFLQWQVFDDYTVSWSYIFKGKKAK